MGDKTMKIITKDNWYEAENYDRDKEYNRVCANYCYVRSDKWADNRC
jgi:hypothetical protein